MRENVPLWILKGLNLRSRMLTVPQIRWYGTFGQVIHGCNPIQTKTNTQLAEISYLYEVEEEAYDVEEEALNEAQCIFVTDDPYMSLCERPLLFLMGVFHIQHTQRSDTKLLQSTYLWVLHKRVVVLYITPNLSHIKPFQKSLWRLKEGRSFNIGNYLEFICSFLNSISVLTIYNIDEPICVVEVMPPQWSQLLLTTNIPNSEKHILVLYFLHIETCTPCYSFLVRYLYCYESFDVNHQMLCSFEHTWNYSLIYLIYVWILFMPSHTHC